jgi:Protein of unknown function (DUF2844)
MNALLTWLRTPVVTIALLVVGSTATLAALGQGEASVIADQQKMGGEIKTTPNTGYTTNEITTPSGTLVREYVSPSGTVFAVSWRGPTPPNLSNLLGSYFKQIQAASSTQKHQSLSHATVATGDVIVQTGGHLRNLWGRAVVSSLVPEGVDEAELK